MAKSEESGPRGPPKYNVGWRRIVRNFSPSCVVCFLDARIIPLTKLQQMVRSDDGHWHCCSTDELGALSHASALLPLDCPLLAECCHLRAGLHHLDSAIRTVSRDLESDDPGSNQLTIPGNRAHGVCHAHRDVGLHLCSALGRVGRLVRVGVVDGGCGCSSVCDTLAVIHPVSHCALFFFFWMTRHTNPFTGSLNATLPLSTGSQPYSCFPLRRQSSQQVLVQR